MKQDKIEEILTDFSDDVDSEYGSIPRLIGITEAKQALYKVIMECLPKELDREDMFYGKSEIEHGFESAYNKALSEIRKNINRVFGKE